jgi:gamma-glutamyl:cysteine ligase YbdK (ATP-grasp superfamily)
MTEASSPLRLFEGYGIELEFMLVDTDGLSVSPVSDRVLRELGGELRNEVEVGGASWSNELVLHVLELKNTLPSGALVPLGDLFSEHVRRMNALLEPAGLRLMPGAMHPWMDPRRETRVWPHEGREIYEAFDRVFDCRRHGWANLQSAQLNLSFGSDDEFGRLHAAIRLLLPILPALAASSPVADGEITGLLDTRLEVYRTNGARVPTTTGSIVPERAFSRAEYERLIYAPMYAELERHDPEGTLRHPWLNARGAIAAFGRDAIEIRVLDVQECPRADVAVACATAAVVKALAAERFIDYPAQRSWEEAPLAAILVATLRDAERTVLRDGRFLEVFGFPDRDGTALDLWQYLLETLAGTSEGLDSPHLRVILERGTLARRILRVLKKEPRREELEVVYRALCDCLERGESFTDH